MVNASHEVELEQISFFSLYSLTKHTEKGISFQVELKWLPSADISLRLTKSPSLPTPPQFGLEAAAVFQKRLQSKLSILGFSLKAEPH